MTPGTATGACATPDGTVGRSREDPPVRRLAGPSHGRTLHIQRTPVDLSPTVVTTSTPSDSLSAACHFPGSPVIDRRTPHPRRTRAEEGLSSSHDGLFDVPRSIRRRVLRHPLQDRRCLPWPSPNSHGLGSPFALRSQATSRRCKLHLMLRTAKLLH